MTIDPLFCGTHLAERIERVEQQLITTATEAAKQRLGDAAFVTGQTLYVDGGPR